MVSMAFINLTTASLSMINPIKTFTSVFNLYLLKKYIIILTEIVKLSHQSLFGDLTWSFLASLADSPSIKKAASPTMYVSYPGSMKFNN